MADRFIKNFAYSFLNEEGVQILVGESEVFDQRPDGEVLVAKAIVTLRSIHQSKIKPAPQLKE